MIYFISQKKNTNWKKDIFYKEREIYSQMHKMSKIFPYNVFLCSMFIIFNNIVICIDYCHKATYMHYYYFHMSWFSNTPLIIVLIICVNNFLQNITKN